MRFRLDHVIPADPVALLGDDTVAGHKSPKVYGKGRHRAPVRSSHSYTAWRYGYKWSGTVGRSRAGLPSQGTVGDGKPV